MKKRVTQIQLHCREHKCIKVMAFKGMKVGA